MSTDSLRKSSQRRWRKRAFLAIGLVAVVASAAALIPGTGVSGESGPRLTHTVTRNDLIVTVTEHGTLESSINTEIKCKVRGGDIPILWVIESGTHVEPGDELIRLETLAFEDRLNEMSKYYHLVTSGAERSRADVARSELAVSEYLEGRYQSQLMRLLAIARSNLTTSQNMLAHAEMMAERGYVSQLELDEKKFAVTQSELNVEVKKTEIDALKEFTRKMQLETLSGNLNSSKARHEGDKERVKLLAAQVDLALADIAHCTVKAERSGIVIYPTGKPWERVPEIEQGATVYMGQTMLLMPDLAQMQVKVGIRETYIDRMKPGLKARVSLPDRQLEGEVSSVASVTGPAGWWNGNAVRYDTIVKLPSVPGLRPGMSAEVELILDRHADVPTIPVAAVVESDEGDFCWVRTADGVKRRLLQLGDTNNVFTVVEAGLTEGDEVVLNPLAFEDAQTLAAKPPDEAKKRKPESTESSGTAKPESPGKANKQKSKPQGIKPGKSTKK
ncbi:MAG: efflux RND transporter periplasmic adaptor subunit [Planctomycetota bacterium]|jgi:multidrug resistance efflux pump